MSALGARAMASSSASPSSRSSGLASRRASRWSSARGRLGTGRRVGTRAAQTAVASSALPPKSRAEAGARDVASWFGSLFGGGGGAAKREAAKAELLAAIDGCERGVTADADRRSAVDAAASRLERLNPTRAALRSPLLEGEWELLYTTSASILGANKPWPFRPLGPIYQTLDAGRLARVEPRNLPILQRRRRRPHAHGRIFRGRTVRQVLHLRSHPRRRPAVRARRVSRHVPRRGHPRSAEAIAATSSSSAGRSATAAPRRRRRSGRVRRARRGCGGARDERRDGRPERRSVSLGCRD